MWNIKKIYFILPFFLQGTLWWIVVRPILYFFVGFKVINYECVKNLKGPVIFAPNHSHSLDAVLLPLALPLWSRFSPIFYVTREGVRYTGWRKFLFTFFNLKHIGAYPITHDKKNYALSLETHKKIIEDGGSMCIFPEGGTTKDGFVRPARGGITYLAATTGVPVVPVLITGTFQLDIPTFLKRKSQVTVEFFPEMYFTELVEYHEGDAELATRYRKFGESILNVIRIAKKEPEVNI